MKNLLDKLLEIAIKQEEGALLTPPSPPSSSLGYEEGKVYFFRMINYHIVGKIDHIEGHIAHFKAGEVAWTADQQRFSDFSKNGFDYDNDNTEIEPIHAPYFLNLDAVTDGFEWFHGIDFRQK